MTFWATFSMIGNDSCARARPTDSKHRHAYEQDRTSPHGFLLVHGVNGMRRSTPRWASLPRSDRGEPAPQGSPRTRADVIGPAIAWQALPAMPAPDGAYAGCP